MGKTKRTPRIERGSKRVRPPVDPPTTAVPREQHGPSGLQLRPYGLDRLRRALHLSDDVPVDQVCEDAAQSIEDAPAASAFSKRDFR